MDFQALLRPVSRRSVFRRTDAFTWCGSATRGEDGKYYLFYSYWPKSSGRGGWVSCSQIGLAVSDAPCGPYEDQGDILPKRGFGWDRDCTHNPTIFRWRGKYYLYYMGNYGNGEFWNHRNHQRIGVAVADAPRGPWTRFDRPVMDVTPGAFDSLMTSNPSVTSMPDGRVLMMYKAVSSDGVLPKGGRVLCGLATADSPLGPFKRYPTPVLVNPENDWSVEDPFVWAQDGRFCALAKDFQGYFTGGARGTTALFESPDGFCWSPARHPLALRLELHWEDGEIQPVANLERPQLLFNERGRPLALCCACAFDAAWTDTANVQIPLA